MLQNKTLFNYRSADKSLARPGRNQATATKLWLFKPLKKKKSQDCPSNQVSAAATASASDEKWRPFNCFFSRVELRTYQHPCAIIIYIYLYRQKYMTLLLRAAQSETNLLDTRCSMYTPDGNEAVTPIRNTQSAACTNGVFQR